ncbi:hypothetical protein B7724_05415 [Streptococcus oralis subsp. tigurinus]|nr:hypothetical protein B7724_05415 [Streptococcus oralis subsp. tigurinus]
MKEGFTITNKEKTPWAPMEIPTRDVKVTKEWEDSAGNDVSAPVDSVKVELYKDGVATGQVQELTKANNWTASFEKLPVSATLGGEAHEYTVKEVGEISNNIQVAGKWYGVRYEGSMKEGFTITNKEKTPWTPMIPPTRDVKVTKEWQDSDGNKIDAPVDSVTVELYKDGAATGQVQELTKDNNWTASFEKLPVSATLGGEAHQYTIKEVGEISNNIQVAGKWYGVGYAGSMKEGFTISNKEKTPWAPMEIPTRDVKVTKEWQDSDGNKIDAPVDSVKVELYKDGVATGQVQELTKDNNWTASFEKLPVSATLGGEAHQYTIKEVGEISNNIQVAGKWYGVGYAGSMKEGFTISNKEKTPTKPSTPNNPESNKPEVPNTSNNKTLPNTGDGSNVSQYVWIMLTSGVLLMLIGYRRKNQG